MNYLQEAYINEKNNCVLESYSHYLKAFDDKKGQAADYINAAFIAFLAQDKGFSHEHQLPVSFINSSWEEMFALLEKGKHNFKKEAILFEFWESYFNLILLGEDDVDYQRCIESSVIDAYFYSMKKNDFEPDLLSKELNKVEKGMSFKDRYLKSLLSSNTKGSKV